MDDLTSKEKNTLKNIQDEIAHVESKLACIISKGYVLSDVIPRDNADILDEDDLTWNNPLWECLEEKKDKLEEIYASLKDLYIERNHLKDKSKELNGLNEMIDSLENTAMNVIYSECE